MSFFYDLNKRLAQVGQTQSLTESATPAVKKQPSTIEQRLRAELDESYKLDELSKGTLGSYAKKAAADAVDLTQRADGEYEYGDPREGEPLEKKAEKRVAGVGKAVDRLTKEDGTGGANFSGSGSLEEKWAGDTELNPEKKGMFKGRDISSLKAELEKLKASGPHKKDSPEYTKMKEINFAIRAKKNWKGGVEEAKKPDADHDGIPDYAEDGIGKMEEGVVDSLKKLGQKAFDKLGGGNDEDLIKDLQRKAGLPQTGKKPEKGVGEDAHAVPYNKGSGKPDAYNGMMFESADKKAKKDYDGDGKIESGKDEYLGSKIAAAKKAGKLKEGTCSACHKDPCCCEEVSEAYGDAFDYKSPRPTTSTGRFDVKKTSTGTVYTLKPETFSDEPEAGGASDGPRKRGRPAKANKAPERVTGKAWKHKDGRQVKEGDDLRGYEQADIEQYDDMLDDGYGDVQIAGITLPTSVALKRCDPTAYRVGLSDFLAHLESEREEMDEEAVSRAQQKFMGMVHSAQKGKKPASKEVAKVAKTMKKSDAKDFASTKHKGLPEKVQKTDEEKTTTRDDHAERAGRKVTKDIEYDEKKKDGIHGKKRGAEDDKAEKAGKKVAKDIEYDEKKKEKKVEETTTSGSVATAPSTGKASSIVGKGIYDSINREVERMISESFNIESKVNEHMADGDEESITVTATGPDVHLLKDMLRNAGIEHLAAQDDCEPEMAAIGLPGEIELELDEADVTVSNNDPDYPTNQEYDDDALMYSGGLNGPKSTGQTTRDPFNRQDARQGAGPVSEGSSFLDLYKAFSKIK